LNAFVILTVLFSVTRVLYIKSFLCINLRIMIKDRKGLRTYKQRFFASVSCASARSKRQERPLQLFDTENLSYV